MEKLAIHCVRYASDRTGHLQLDPLDIRTGDLGDLGVAEIVDTMGQKHSSREWRQRHKRCLDAGEYLALGQFLHSRSTLSGDLLREEGKLCPVTLRT